jgi:prephenate dehydrogenase
VADRSGRRRVFAEVELTILATPVSSIIELLPEVVECCGLVTDCGSTKRSIVERVDGVPGRARFVPGHPMAGRPQGGLSHARADLFSGQTWILCPERCAEDALSQVIELVTGLGARPLLMSALEHDRAVALTSHVPQLLASALTVLAAKTGAERAAGPAFASATRVAGGSGAMWADIFSTNADAIADALQELGTELQKIASELRGPGTNTAALELLSQARALRQSR